MPAYPPPIARDDFWDVDTGPSPGCDPCSLEAFGLVAMVGNAPGPSFAGDHDAVADGDDGRVAIAAGSEVLQIAWRFANPQHVHWARIELFSHRHARVLHGSKLLEWPDGSPAATGWSPFSGSIDPADDATATTTDRVTVAEPTHEPVAFPDRVLTVEHAPYKLKMTIGTHGGRGVQTAVRWIYVDVAVADLTLTLGEERLLPAETAIPARGFNRRNRALRAAVEQNLGPARRISSDAVATLDLPLEGNLFGVSVAEWSTDAAFGAWRAAWRDGPYLPLVLDVRVRSFTGAPMPAPRALGTAKFLWDWRGGAHPAAYFHALDRANLNAALDHQPGDWPTGARNAHVDFGGKRGAGARLFKHDDTGHTGYVDAGAGRFPFRMTACGQRHGAVVSLPRTTGDQAGRTGVVFQPSIQSGDEYRLDVYFAYRYPTGWDVDSTAAHLAAHLPFEVPRVASARCTVRRVVRVARHWTPYANFDATTFDWGGLARDYFAPAGITLDVSAVDGHPTRIARGRFRDLFTAAIQELPISVRQAFGGADEQLQAEYGIHFRSQEDFRGTVELLYGERSRATARRYQLAPNPIAEALSFLQIRAETLMELVHDEVQADQGSSVRARLQNYWNNIGNFMGADEVPQIVAGGLRQHLHTVRNVPMAVPHGASDDVRRKIQTIITEIEEITQALCEDPTAGGQGAAMDAIWRYVWARRSWPDRCKSWAATVLERICAELSKDPAAGDGMQVFQFDFADNLDNFPNSGEAITTTSNRATCPECEQPLNDDDRARNLCPRLTCGATLRTKAAVITYIPWRLMRPFSSLALAKLQRNWDKYAFITNMEGARPEILVAHEMGHHLFMPHSPSGFREPNPFPGWWIWRFYRLATYFNPALRDRLIEQSRPGGAKADYHAANHHACIMGYNFPAMPDLHFCFKCALRLRGWRGARVSTL